MGLVVETDDDVALAVEDELLEASLSTLLAACTCFAAPAVFRDAFFTGGFFF